MYSGIIRQDAEHFSAAASGYSRLSIFMHSARKLILFCIPADPAARIPLHGRYWRSMISISFIIM